MGVRMKEALKQLPGLVPLFKFVSRRANARSIPDDQVGLQRRWTNHISDELRFWDHWLRDKGWKWKEQYEFRMQHDSELQGELAALLPSEPPDEIRILDVGAGPLTELGKCLLGKKIAVYATDALASEYDVLLKKYSIHPPVRTQTCHGEELTKLFEHDYFDLVFCQNALDHMYDPLKALQEMAKIVKHSGAIFLRHFENEGINEAYRGLHSWNITAVDGDVLIWNPKRRTNVSDILPRYPIEVSRSNHMLEIVIRSPK
jgi:2-polyprenyl-3-methyl-5-hydroxy-6-metoxy-1,4-benzoquinol methylase